MELTKELILAVWNETTARISEEPFYLRFASALLAAHNAKTHEKETSEEGHWIEEEGEFGDRKMHWVPDPKPKVVQPQPITDAARDAQDAKRYRFIKSQMKVGAVQTQLPLYRTLHWIGYEDCSDVRNADAAIDAEIERLDRAKGE